jgi:3-methyladenine DNA glycosylase AlkD
MGSREAARLVRKIRARLAALPLANTAAVRTVRREFSRQVANEGAEVVMETALSLLNERSSVLTFFGYELVSRHRETFERLEIKSLLKLGATMNSWASVDCFGLYLSGPTWLHGRIADRYLQAWARSENLWWRRAALVSTVALSRHGSAEGARRVLAICTELVTDREDMVVKALSWALRELSKKHPDHVRRFVSRYREALAARVIREVQNKLTTGLKTPKRGRGERARSQK